MVAAIHLVFDEVDVGWTTVIVKLSPAQLADAFSVTDLKLRLSDHFNTTAQFTLTVGAVALRIE